MGCFGMELFRSGKSESGKRKAESGSRKTEIEKPRTPAFRLAGKMEDGRRKTEAGGRRTEDLTLPEFGCPWWLQKGVLGYFEVGNRKSEVGRQTGS